MDPRHPEQALSRLKELIAQYDKIEDKIANATISTQLSQLEREGGLVVQEMCLVAPRIHESMMQASRQRRHDLARGVVENPVEKYVEPNQAETVIVEPNYKRKKKTTRKKKTVKKADK